MVKNYLIKKLVFRKRLGLLAEKIKLYQTPLEGPEIVRRQIDRFNRVWWRCQKTIPFYSYWLKKHHLPEQISCLDDLQTFPPLTREIIRENQDMIFRGGRIQKSVSTGGSSGTPVRFPSAPEDGNFCYADIYLGRSWWGIRPLDPALLFWGHSHLFGTGIRGRLEDYRRRIWDRLLNMTRLNAYDMTLETLQAYYEAFRNANPCLIIGYPSCLYKLAKCISESGRNCGRKDKLKAVILTSETATPSDIELLEKTFRVKVAIEYGMAETGVIGYSHEATWNIRIFWDSFLATVDSDGALSVSTLYDRFFPLIHYKTDDRVEGVESCGSSVLRISSVVGRKQEVLSVRSTDGAFLELSGILIVHILKRLPHIFSIQVRPLTGHSICILLVADRPLNLPHIKRFFLDEISKDHQEIDAQAIDFKQVNVPSKTIAGKEPLVMNEA